VGETRSIVATVIGNMLEWYDFTVYALFAAYIAGSFFPATDEPGSRLLKTFLVFGLGFVVRPLGALLIGSFGDRAGRKAALMLTIWLMAAGTALIAFAPTYASVGIAAPLVLLAGRLLQGFSAGGEVGGAAAYLLESAALDRRGRVASWLQASMGLANILGALVAFSVTASLSPAQMRAWGWRIPFLLGLLIAPAGLVLRRTLHETEAFKSRSGRDRAPLFQVFAHHKRKLLNGFAVAVLWAVAVYVLMIFLPTYVQRSPFNFPAREAFGASLIGNLPFVLGCVLFGALSDRIGRRLSLSLSAAAILIGVLPLMIWLRTVPTFTTLIVVQSALCIMVSSFVGVAPSALSESFPPAVRSTGTSLVYNGAFTVFGGFAPSFLTLISQRSNASVFAPAWYVMCAAFVTLLAVPFLKESSC